MEEYMFTYVLPGGLFTRTYFQDEKIKFDPPVYEQRYTTTIRIIEDERWCKHFKKVVDFGCAEMKLLPLLRRIETIEHIMEVDIDGLLLESHTQIAEPLVSDYLKRRANPLRIELFQGSIISPVENLRNVDVVIGLEIVEHLYPNVLEKVPENVFGFIQPKLVIFSTPNADFNELFYPMLGNGFRHFDHKFEWNRKEFKEWTLNICQEYPNYKVSIIGVGDPPETREHLGKVSQIAIFARLDILGEELVNPILEDKASDASADIQYKAIHIVEFPYEIDNRTKEQKIIDEANYVIQNGRYVEGYINYERNVREIPLDKVLVLGQKLDIKLEDLYEILKNENFEILNNFIILPVENENDTDRSDNEENDWNPYEDIDADFETDLTHDYNKYCNVSTEEPSDNWD